MKKAWSYYLIWLAGAAVLGFLTPALFAGVLKMPRLVYLIPYVLLAGSFVFAFFRWSNTDWVALLKQHWVLGLIGAILLGIFTVNNIRSQPSSPSSTGLELVIDLLWLGVVYGALDALLLSVVPVLATWQAFSLLGWTASWVGKVGVGALALVASLLVTAAYHLGYPEYRGFAIASPVFGNGMMTLGYLITTNPLAAILSHIAMHVAGVLQGPATVVQLPPHY